MMPENQGVLLAGVEAGQDLPDLAYDVSASTVVLGALASRDWRPMHHDHDLHVWPPCMAAVYGRVRQGSEKQANKARHCNT